MPKGVSFLGLLRNGRTGAARLSSARGLSCTLKWVNERNPRCQLQVSGGTAPYGGGRRGRRQISVAL